MATVTTTRIHALAARSTARGHELLAGEGRELGGDDEGMTPHELLQAALASCTVLTCQMYANRKQWPLERTDVRVELTAVVDGRASLRREVAFVGAQLTDAQRQRLLEIADRCPIHKLLTHASEIRTTLLPTLTVE